MGIHRVVVVSLMFDHDHHTSKCWCLACEPGKLFRHQFPMHLPNSCVRIQCTLPLCTRPAGCLLSEKVLYLTCSPLRHRRRNRGGQGVLEPPHFCSSVTSH